MTTLINKITKFAMIPLLVVGLNECRNEKLENITGIVVYSAQVHQDITDGIFKSELNPFYTYVIYNKDTIVPVDFYRTTPLHVGDSVKVTYVQNKIFSELNSTEKEGVKTIKRGINEAVAFKKFKKVDNKTFYSAQSKIREDRSELQNLMDSIVSGE